MKNNPEIYALAGYGNQSPKYQHDVEYRPIADVDSLTINNTTRGPRWTTVSALRYFPTLAVRTLRSCVLHCSLRKFPRFILMMLGCYQLALICASLIDALSPDSALSVLASVVFDGSLRGDTLSVANAVSPIACHSHNDYWRLRPLFSALEVGCSSVEADVWLEGNELLVGHLKTSVSPERTLSSMYIAPILEILNRRNHASSMSTVNGVFESNPLQSLVLVVDFKAEGQAIWPVFNEKLEPLRERNYLTYFNGTDVVDGPVTIVVSGDTWFSDIVRNTTHRDVFLDAPLHYMDGSAAAMQAGYLDDGTTPADTILDNASELQLPLDRDEYSPANSYYASVSYMHSIGYPTGSRLSQHQLDLIRAQIEGAHERGLKVRYWGVPAWPLGIRNYLWRVLVREGVDYLSVDDIKAAARGDWGPRKGGWQRKWWT